MPRTKPVAAKSTGGRIDWGRAKLAIKVASIEDHSGDTVRLAYVHKRWYPGQKEDDSYFPPWPFQIYVLESARETTQDPDFASAFAKWVEKSGGVSDGDCKYHFEIYEQSFDNILACVAHQRREIYHRNSNGRWPRLVSRWSTRPHEGYAGFISIIDRDDWATEGFLSVRFDPLAYDQSTQSPVWNSALEGDFHIVHAERRRDFAGFFGHYRDYFNNAGHSWVQGDIERRNNGLSSPALYPAVDPDSRFDAEHDEDDELSAHNVPAMQPHLLGTGTGEDEDEDDNEPKIKSKFSEQRIWGHSNDFENIVLESYSDFIGWPITSVWDIRHGRLRPIYTFTLYVAADVPPYLEKALFGCMNQGLLIESPWTLDVIRHVPDLASALYHNSHEAPRRRPERLAAIRVCTKMILQKTLGHRFPKELLLQIEDLLVPPPYMNYSSLPVRELRNVFLFLDARSQYHGPQLVYSDPTPNATNETSQTQGQTRIFQSPYVLANTEKFEGVLIVSNLRFWHRVSDEMHTLWSLSSSRHCLSPSMMPCMTLRIVFPETCWYNPLLSSGCPLVTFSLISHAQRPITIHRHPLFNQDIAEESIEIIDTESGQVITTKSSKRRMNITCYDSWSRDPDLGVESPGLSEASAALPVWGRFCTIHPEQAIDLPLDLGDLWWRPRSFLKDPVFKDDQQYRVRLKTGLTVPRWTFGTADKMEGPYNLPEIPVRLENEVIFTFTTQPPNTPALPESRSVVESGGSWERELMV